MPDGTRSFDYVAVDPAGRRVKGSLPARDDTVVFERLRRDGLSPIRIRVARARGAASASAKGVSDRDLAAFLSDLGALLKAGTDIRAALEILGAKSGRPEVRTLARSLAAQISGGGALDLAFASSLGRGRAFIGALVAAGEASGDIASGFERAAEMLTSRIKLRDELVSTLAYPGFVLVATIVAIAVILFFIVPSLAPLVEDAGARPPFSLRVLIGVSTFLRGNLIPLVSGAVLLVGGATLAGVAGLLNRPVDRFLLDGPARRTVGGLVFGAFALALGNMLAAGAPMTEALRLAIRSVRSPAARERLDTVAHAVRQGQSLSVALERVRMFPFAVVRLAAVGEASGALGAMLSRAGALEEQAAIRRIEGVGRLLGPALIVLLGGLIGSLMAGLLSGVSQLGDSALQ